MPAPVQGWWRGEGLAVSSASTVGSDETWRRRAREWAGAASTTPNVLLIASVAIAASMAVVALVAVGVASGHRDAAATIVEDAAPIVVTAQELHLALATAGAAASTAYLQAGLESPTLREQYESALAEAGRAMTSIADEPVNQRTDAALATIAEQLTVYAGLVETARTNNRMNNPVGAAYLRDATDLMRDEILPAALVVFGESARDLDDEYRSGRSRQALVVLLVVALAVAILLAAVQVFVARRSRRLLNLGLLVASAALVALAVLAVTTIESQRDRLDASRRSGAEPLLVGSASRILVLRSLNDENLYLVERGTDDVHRDDFDLVVAHLGDGETGLVAAAARAADDEGPTIEAYRAYLAAHQEVRALVDARQVDDAITSAVDRLAPAANALDGRLGDTVASAETRLASEARAAHDDSGLLLRLSVVLSAVAAVAAVVGLDVRRREYR
jgi:hypothetical protein